MNDAPYPGRLDGSTHLLPVRIYYEDTDFSGLVYHARYLHFLERGRTDFLRCCGVNHSDLLEREDPLVLAVRKMTLEYERPARIDDALLVRTVCRETAGARLWMDQEIHRDGDRLLTAEVEAVCLTPQGRPRRPPKDFVEKLGPLLTKANM